MNRRMRTIRCLPVILILCCPLFMLEAQDAAARQPLTLDELKSSLRANNTDLLLLREDLKQSELDVKDAEAAFQPTVDLDFSATWMANPEGPITMSVDELRTALLGTPSTTGQYIPLYEGMESTLYNFGATITQPLFTWGKIKTSVRLRDAIAEARRYELLDKTSSMETELASHVAAIYHLGVMQSLLERQREDAGELVASVQQAADTGMALKQDVAEARIQAQQVERALLETSYELSSQVLETGSLAGIPDLQASDITYVYDEQAIRAFMDKPREEIVNLAISPSQPSLMALAKLEETAAETERIANSSVYWKPDLALVVSAGYAGPSFPFIENDWEDEDDYSFNVTVGMSVTAWDGGKKLNDIKRAASQRTSAYLHSESARNTIARTVERELLQMEILLQKIDLQQEKIDTLADRSELNALLYESGYGKESDAITARIEELGARVELEQLRLDLTLSWLTVRHLVGETSFTSR